MAQSAQELNFAFIKKNFMHMRKIFFVSIALILSSVVLNFAFWQAAAAAPAYQIDGYYLGASPDDIGVTVDMDPDFQEKYFEVEVNR